MTLLSRCLYILLLLTIIVIVVTVSCSRMSDERRDSDTTVETTPQHSGHQQAPLDHASEIAQWLEDGAKVAAMTREERHANWTDDVIEIEGPPIETILPKLSTVNSISASLAGDDGKDVKFKIPESHWSELFDLFADSHPIELESEIWTLGSVKITVANGEPYWITVFTDFGNPIIYRANNRQNGNWLHFATRRSEPEVLAFFESLPGYPQSRKLGGYFPRREAVPLKTSTPKSEKK